MTDDIEIIDVDACHGEKKRNTGDSMRRKYQKLEVDVKDLATKNNSLRHANDALRRRVFDKEQCSQRVARLLGFEDIESAQARITAEDPWIPGGQAALADALARNSQLEGELAKSVATNKEAQSAIREAQDQLSDVEAEATRLRKERDSARQVAERQAADAYRWRTEVQTTLPEMQIMVQELQIKNEAKSEPRGSVGKENEASSSPLRDLINTTFPIAVDAVSPDTSKVSDSQHYKQQFELIQTQYNALLESKKRVSKNYKEDLIRWKKFKEWMVKDGKGVGGHRLVRRRKKTEEIGPNPDTCELCFSDPSAPVPAKLDGPMDDPDVTLLDPTNAVEAPGHGSSDKHQHPPDSTGHPYPLSPVQSPLNHGPELPSLKESLTQRSSIPPTSASPLRVAPASRAPLTNKSIPSSQESLTQQSSPPPLSPLQEHIVALPSKAKMRREIPEHKEIITDSSPNRLRTMKQELPQEEGMANNNHERPSRPQATNQHDMPLRPLLTPDHRTDMPMTRSELPPDHKRPRTLLLRSEPPPVNRTKAGPSFSLDPKANTRAIRRTSTVLVKDTPPRASARAVFRHHSSPPDSPHVSCEDPDSSPSAMRRGKRKASEMQEEEGDQENNSDPFVEGPSCTKATDSVLQTREGKTAHLKALGKKPHKEYMADYMQFKGRGRYSKVTTATEKTVNAEFEIDPARNSGLDYQFDAVVRDKAERKKLEAGDCECCREYYEAVGPLPPRLQPPLWRSPSSSQSQHRPCRRNNGEPSLALSTPAQKKVIEAHKHEISRHRHNWAPTNTPPNYWRIGFPDTQEVEDINRRANDLHARKFQRVEAEANSKDGRYRKRS